MFCLEHLLGKPHYLSCFSWEPGPFLGLVRPQCGRCRCCLTLCFKHPVAGFGLKTTKQAVVLDAWFCQKGDFCTLGLKGLFGIIFHSF